jgi:glycosyltransferase involved in cell wall biosynthesis
VASTVPDLAIVMPVFNERATIEKAIRDVLAAELPLTDYELLVIDDGSSDGTREFLETTEWPPTVRVLAHERNRGKGAAIKTALGAASAGWTVIMDADLEYDPADLAVVLEPLIGGEAEVVFGARTFKSHTAFNFWYVVGNKGLTLIANLLFNTWLSDIMTCYKAMPTELFRSLDLREDGFAIEPEIAARVLLDGIPIYEVPVSYRARRREEGKKLSAMDGVRVLRTLVRCRIAPSP